MILRAAAILAMLAGPAGAEALPVISPDGPDAALYGAAEGYPVGTAATSGQPEFMVGWFSHNDSVVRYHRVAPAAEPAPFLRAPTELMLSYRYQGAMRDPPDYLSRNPTTGLLIVRDRTVMFEHYQYGRTEADRFLSQSMAKTVTSMLVGIAVGEGHIRSIDDVASAYVPELAGTQVGATPLRALLHMASGIAFQERYDGHDDAARLGQALTAPGSRGPVAAVSLFEDRVAPPDTVWNYAALNTETLGLVLARATGMSLADYLSSRIWSRIGTESEADWVTDRSGQEAAYCCLRATLRDWARFAELLAHDGAWNGRQIIPREWVVAATTPAPPGSFLAPRTMSRFYGYGFQVWLLPGDRRQFALLGIHGQVILIDPTSKLVLVHTAVRIKPTRDPAGNELLALWRALVAQEGGS